MHMIDALTWEWMLIHSGRAANVLACNARGDGRPTCSRFYANDKPSKFSSAVAWQTSNHMQLIVSFYTANVSYMKPQPISAICFRNYLQGNNTPQWIFVIPHIIFLITQCWWLCSPQNYSQRFHQSEGANISSVQANSHTCLATITDSTVTAELTWLSSENYLLNAKCFLVSWKPTK